MKRTILYPIDDQMPIMAMEIHAKLGSEIQAVSGNMKSDDHYHRYDTHQLNVRSSLLSGGVIDLTPLLPVLMVFY